MGQQSTGLHCRGFDPGPVAGAQVRRVPAKAVRDQEFVGFFERMKAGWFGQCRNKMLGI